MQEKNKNKNRTCFSKILKSIKFIIFNQLIIIVKISNIKRIKKLKKVKIFIIIKKILIILEFKKLLVLLKYFIYTKIHLIRT
jgi:hypothetical protein